MKRWTRQKQMLTEELDKMKGFFSAEAFYEQVQKRDTKIGIATIYRFLKESELHAYMCDRRQVYSKQKTHCHFICERTGKIIHFDVDSIDFLKNKFKGSITSVQVEVRGELK